MIYYLPSIYGPEVDRGGLYGARPQYGVSLLLQLDARGRFDVGLVQVP